MKTIALLTFIAVYALLLLLPKYRAVSALSAAALFLLLRIVPLGDVAGTVDWNVLMMLAGTMGTVDLFIRSNMPNRLSDRLVAVLPSVKWLIIALALFAGLVSAFVDNVATVLMLAPVGLAISKKLNISPVQPILAIAVSSNLQGQPRWWGIPRPSCWAVIWDWISWTFLSTGAVQACSGWCRPGR